MVLEVVKIQSWEVNVLATRKLAGNPSTKDKVKQIIFASSGSVYGLKKRKKLLKI